MKIAMLRTCIATLVATIVAHSFYLFADDATEPEIKYSLKVGDKTIKLVENESIRVDGSFTNPEVKLTAEPNRTFTHGRISFDYPRFFTFEFDKSTPGIKTWTLSGNDLKVIFTNTAVKLTVDAYLNEMMTIFGKEKCSKINKSATIKLGEEELTGASFVVTLASQKLSIEIYEISVSDKESRLVVFQDSVTSDDGHTDEGKKTLELLKKTFKKLP